MCTQITNEHFVEHMYFHFIFVHLFSNYFVVVLYICTACTCMQCHCALNCIQFGLYYSELQIFPSYGHCPVPDCPDKGDMSALVQGQLDA